MRSAEGRAACPPSHRELIVNTWTQRTLLAATLACALAPPALADSLKPWVDEYGVVSRVERGIAELGLDNVLIFTSRSESDNGTDGSSTNVTFIGGPTFRYFIIDNLSLGLNANFLMRSASVETTVGAQTTSVSATELGVLGTLHADYLLRVGRGMFVKPGLGLGGFWTSADVPIEGSALERSATTVGGVVRAQLGLVYYTSAKFNLRASIDTLLLFGKRTSDDEVIDVSVFELDLGWNVGFSYVF